jgi:histidine triad (HIT) family protein
MNESCVFCRIIHGKAQASILYRDEWVTAFRDIHPVAPTHILIVPNRHVPSVNEIELDDELVMGRLISTAQKLAAQEAVAKTGYRLILNTGTHAHQVVDHLHLHLIGGRPMRHPIG